MKIVWKWVSENSLFEPSETPPGEKEVVEGVSEGHLMVLMKMVMKEVDMNFHSIWTPKEE